MFPLGVINQQMLGGGGGSPFWSHSWTEDGSPVALANRLGFKFTVGGASLTCNTLSYYANAYSDENVRIHRVSDGALIAEATITEDTINTWLNVTVTEFTLVAGVSYTCSSRNVIGGNRSIFRNHVGLSYVAGITHTGYVYGSSNDMPTSPTSNLYAACRFGYVAP